MRAHFRFSISREMRLMTYANSKQRDLIGRATFFCFVKLPVRGVTRPPFPLLAEIRGLARETSVLPRGRRFCCRRLMPVVLASKAAARVTVTSFLAS